MKYRPILFSAPMVRALLSGSKTQTRRVVKPQPEWTEPATTWQQGDGHSGPGWYAHNEDYPDEGALFYRCPYGQPGDRLWVRESFDQIIGQSGTWIETDYRATYTHGDRLGDTIGIKKRWTPSIHMPRSVSRITLDITGVRVERLQDISEADAAAEGVSAKHTADAHYTAREAYAVLWEQINGPDSWAANPWVWVIEFKRVDK